MVTYKQIYSYVQDHIDEMRGYCIDHMTGEFNLTLAEEDVINAFNIGIDAEMRDDVSEAVFEVADREGLLA
jgi:hypothetical protein